MYNIRHLHKVEHKRAPKRSKSAMITLLWQNSGQVKTHLPSKLCWCPCGWERTIILAYFFITSLLLSPFFPPTYTFVPVLCSYS